MSPCIECDRTRQFGEVKEVEFESATIALFVCPEHLARLKAVLNPTKKRSVYDVPFGPVTGRQVGGEMLQDIAPAVEVLRASKPVKPGEVAGAPMNTQGTGAQGGELVEGPAPAALDPAKFESGGPAPQASPEALAAVEAQFAGPKIFKSTDAQPKPEPKAVPRK
jgi:hypothetical protein